MLSQVRFFENDLNCSSTEPSRHPWPTALSGGKRPFAKRATARPRDRATARPCDGGFGVHGGRQAKQSGPLLRDQRVWVARGRKVRIVASFSVELPKRAM